MNPIQKILLPGLLLCVVGLQAAAQTAGDWVGNWYVDEVEILGDNEPPPGLSKLFFQFSDATSDNHSGWPVAMGFVKGDNPDIPEELLDGTWEWNKDKDLLVMTFNDKPGKFRLMEWKGNRATLKVIEQNALLYIERRPS